ncbi:MAG: hypothetical protein CWE10_10545 [Symbiobacterium thermophilum]|uniref:Uncharacterized protein n=1 Tax=Symbiobacterium thermophilum TaxID=2734 RepID=A0A953IC51_SYMTR|nr:hypothetical protein [Symbiobacterium thermophilum]
MKTAIRWVVRNHVPTARGIVSLDELTGAERQAIVDRIYLAMARAMAPEGVEVRLARGHQIHGQDKRQAI